jgi:hypothetical protein
MLFAKAYLRKVAIGHVTCSGRNKARKSGENRYSFSIPLWFALRHHFFVEKTMSYYSMERQVMLFFDKKKDQTNL